MTRPGTSPALAQPAKNMTLVVPFPPGGSTDALALLPASRAAAAQAGVTRLADITRLDRIGLPVWQAVRQVFVEKGWLTGAALP